MLRIVPLEEAQNFITRKAVRLAEAEQTVAPILEAVRKRGDEAVLEYARKLDGLDGNSFRVPESEWREAEARVQPEFRAALQTASKNIREYAEMQLPEETWMKFPDGRRLGYIVRPLESMGAYIPAGRYPLPSTLLMTAIPAQVAGVKTICVVSPRPSPEILVASKFLNVTNIFRVGGAQAIAALAFGTATIPKVDRIVGPGNIYVAAAKKLLAGEVGIDFVAGPTEIVIIAEDADPRHVAADMLAQAEHDIEASAILLTTSKKLAEAVVLEVARQLETLPTAEVACQSIRNNSAVILCPSVDAAVEASNHLAPEH
jgi:histidinol dehydrogenase